jgi:hypothetical protein
LSGRLGRAPDQRRDLLEGQVEQVVEDEREALGGGQGIDHDLQGEADRVGQQHLLFGIEPALQGHDRIRDARLQGLLALGVARAQQVETDPGDDRGQPRLEVADLVGPCAADTLPGVLDGVVGVGQ